MTEAERESPFVYARNLRELTREVSRREQTGWRRKGEFTLVDVGIESNVEVPKFIYYMQFMTQDIGSS